jgi:maltose/moltooligosaccharide transporter
MAEEIIREEVLGTPFLPTTKPKPHLTFGQIWNMSFGFLGIQFGFALQNANVSRIFQTLGADPGDLPLFWLAAPLTGLIVQPIIGYLSDRTWHPKWGRRRPYFFIGSVLATCALFIMPNSAALWIAVGTLWLMDASINISMEPFRAFVGDKLPSEQRTTGFAMQTFFIGVGAVVASQLPYIFTNYFGISNEAPSGQIPDSVKYSFYIGGIAFLTAVMWTVFTTKEFPPDSVETFEEEKLRTKGIWKGLKEILQGFGKMPTTMAQLAIVQFFSWLALFAMWIYTTGGIAENVFGTTDASSALFQEAGNWVGVMFAVYNLVSALAAFLLPPLARRIGRKQVHLTSLVIGGLSLISLFFIRDKNMLLVPMIGVGIAWASILTMPYAILAGVLPPNKMGYYMGVFNFFIVIPQVVAGLILGSFVTHVAGGHSIYALVFGGGSMMLAGVLSLRVKDAD